MKRFHVNVSVADLSQSIQFYTTLFGQEPSVARKDYRSTKTWVRDPDSVVWETFVTHNEITHYGQNLAPETANESTSGSRCCA
jgi:catechol 2,3-dioxygenase-like lactoylglutathione lyase family enzyme